MNIISFNILANKYAKIGPEGFSTTYKATCGCAAQAKPDCKFCDLDKEGNIEKTNNTQAYDMDIFDSRNRLENMKKIFDKYIKQKSIFCLQEVDIFFCQELQHYFNENDYNFYHEYFSGRRDRDRGGYTVPLFSFDIMGVATAVPKEYKVLEVFRYNPMWYSGGDIEAAPGVLKQEFVNKYKVEGVTLSECENRAKLYVDNKAWLVPPFIYPCWPKVPELTWTQKWTRGIATLGKSLMDITPYEKFLNIKNTLLVLKIDTGARKFLICNIQMPNLNEGVPMGVWVSHERSIPETLDEKCFMEAYMYLILKFIQHISKSEADDPDYCYLHYILAGSFNVEPQSLTHQLIRYGKFSLGTSLWINNYFPKEAHKYFPIKGIEDKIGMAKEDIEPMRSAFGVRTGKEPVTVKRYHCGIAFKGTLDYIFICNGIAPVGVSTLEELDDSTEEKYKAGVQAYLPNKLNPSDHLPILVQLSFKR